MSNFFQGVPAKNRCIYFATANLSLTEDDCIRHLENYSEATAPANVQQDIALDGAINVSVGSPQVGQIEFSVFWNPFGKVERDLVDARKNKKIGYVKLVSKFEALAEVGDRNATWADISNSENGKLTFTDLAPNPDLIRLGSSLSIETTGGAAKQYIVQKVPTYDSNGNAIVEVYPDPGASIADKNVKIGIPGYETQGFFPVRVLAAGEENIAGTAPESQTMSNIQLQPLVEIPERILSATTV